MTRQIFALLILVASSLAVAQDQSQSNSAQDNGTQPAMVDDQRAPAPALLTGDASSLSFSPEMERSNYLRLGIGVGATYDDNASNASTPEGRIGDFGYTVTPSIQLDQTRSRLHWTLGYNAGLTVNQRLTQRNQGTHNLIGTLQYRLSPHVDLRLSDSFLDTTGLLQQFQNGLGTPVTGPINQPNPTIITPLAKSINNTGTVDLSYQYSAFDVVGVGGTFYDSHFRDLPSGSAPLMDTRTRSGNAYYNHRFGARNWTGLTYKFQRMTFGAAEDTNTTHSLLVTHTIYFTEHTTLSLFAGPEYSELNTHVLTLVIAPPVISFATVSSNEHFWSAATGANFGWQGKVTSVHVAVARQVSDGGGVLGAVRLTSVTGGIRRQLAKSTAADLNIRFGHNKELGSNFASVSALKSASGNVGLEQQLGQNFVLRLDYGRDYEKGGLYVPNGSINHNRGSISIAYKFTRPLGR
jgi:hypothetical protein